MKDTDNSKLTFIIVITFPSPFLSLITNQAVTAYLLQVTCSGRMDSLITVRAVRKASDRNINYSGFSSTASGHESTDTPHPPKKQKLKSEKKTLHPY